MTTPILKTNLRTVIAVTDSDLDDFIHEVYGRKDFNCVADQEWGNYQDHEIELDIAELDEADQKQLADYLSGRRYGSHILFVLMQDMVNRKVIEPGNYLISVFW